MNLKKPVSLILSFAIASSYAVGASAASWTESESRVDATWIASLAGSGPYYRNYGTDSLFSYESDYYAYTQRSQQLTFTAYLSSRLSGENPSRDVPLPQAGVGGPTIGASSEGGLNNVTDFIDGYGATAQYLPTKIRRSDLRLIQNNLNSPKIYLPVSDPRVGAIYRAYLTAANAGRLADSLPSANAEVNLALSVKKVYGADSDGYVQFTLAELPIGGLNGAIEYKVDSSWFSGMLADAGLDSETLTLYNGDPRNHAITVPNPQKPTVRAGNTAEFTLNKSNGYSVYYMKWDETQYITQKEAEEKIQAEVDKKLAAAEEAFREKIVAELKEYIDGQKYISAEDVPGIIEDYFSEEENLKSLIESVFHKSFDNIIEEKLKEYFGTSTDLGSYGNLLQGYIVGTVLTELKNLNSKLDKLEERINDAIRNQIDSIFNQNTTTESLTQFLTAISVLLKGQDGTDGSDGRDGRDGRDGKDGKDGKDGNDGKDGSDGKDGNDGAPGRDGQDGKDGKDGIDGEDFAEWATKNYGGIANFINQISFEGWARSNYGSVDNFIRSISGTNGLSAYELAVQSGYYGSLGQWLESLRGDDGKSAYDLAVENGYRGSLDDWLESLQGEDGADGENGADGEDGRDGRDGRDGNVVYVNGAYGQLPNTDTNTIGTGTGATVTPTSSGTDAGSADISLTVDETPRSYASKGAPANPATGAAVGILLPAAAAFSVFLVKKGGRKRGRK